MIKRLQIKFVAINMTIVTIMLAVIFGLVYHFTKCNMEIESISMMQSIAADPFHLGSPKEESSDMRLPYFTLQIGPRGELISTGGGYYDLSDQEFLRNLIDVSISCRRNTGTVPEHHLRFYRAATPMGIVLVFSDTSSETKTLDNLMKTSLLIGCFAFFVFLGISIFLSKWAIQPVANAWQQQKQFIADASHELKTPLTVIMTNAELLRDPEQSEPMRAQFSNSILTMSQQMRHLVEKMLELAQVDDQQGKLSMKSLNLSELAEDTALFFEGVFVEKGLSLESVIEPDISICGNEEAMQQVMDILLDNAQKYSSPQGETRIQLYRVGTARCHLAVSNPGAEIPEEDRKKIFQRFYRADKARSRDGSFGLGLSIAEKIVLQHHGKIWCESRDGRNTFFVELKRKR